MFTAKEVARMLKLPLSTFYRRVSKGMRPRPKRIGGRMFWTAESVFLALRVGKVKFSRFRKRKPKKLGRPKEGVWPTKRRAQKRKMPKVYIEAKREAERWELLRRRGAKRG